MRYDFKGPDDRRLPDVFPVGMVDGDGFEIYPLYTSGATVCAGGLLIPGSRFLGSRDDGCA
jgi:hypothetical protein